MGKRKLMVNRSGRLSRLAASAALTIAGLAYMLFPAPSSSNYFDGSWVSVIWGFFIFGSGVVMFLGVKTQVLQLEQLGVAIGIVGVSVYTVTRAIMATVPLTPGRAGLAGLSAAFVLFLLARYFELGGDIRSSKLSRTRSGEGGINV